MTACLLLAAGSASIGLAACGGGSDSSSTGSTASGGTSAEAPLPPNAPQTAVIRHQFPKPKPTEGAPRDAMKAIKQGEKACSGKTPIEVREEFMAKAQESGRLNSGQEKMVEQIGKYEKQSGTAPDFVAGQLAAGVYEATLSEKKARSGYQGCVYALAVHLRHELSEQGTNQGK